MTNTNLVELADAYAERMAQEHESVAAQKDAGYFVPTIEQARDALVAAIEAQAKQIEALKKEVSTLDILLEECKMDWSGDVAQLKAEHKWELETEIAKAKHDVLEQAVQLLETTKKVRTGENIEWTVPVYNTPEKCIRAIRALKEQIK